MHLVLPSFAPSVLALRAFVSFSLKVAAAPNSGLPHLLFRDRHVSKRTDPLGIKTPDRGEG